MIYVESRKKNTKTLEKAYPNAQIIDLTSKSNSKYIKFSPFYPHGDIPVPFSEGVFSYSVEGVWQGLKVFESQDVNLTRFNIQNMKGIKRTIRVCGNILGHRKGVNGKRLFNYLDARMEIYIPTYNWVLENKLQKEIQDLEEIAKSSDLVLLDYDTNIDLNNCNKPLSHAGLVKNYIEKRIKPFKEPIQGILNF